ncbi:MAG: PCRF domain-containing protein, partial [Hyphomicrobiaceae bacterium]
MSAIPAEKLEQITERWMAIQHELSNPIDQDQFRKLSKEFAQLDPVVATIRELEGVREEIAGLKEMVADGSDKEMVDLAREELAELEPRLGEVDHKLKIQLLPKDDADDRSVILEVRAGTGGDEAALFAADLFRMYQRYA